MWGEGQHLRKVTGRGDDGGDKVDAAPTQSLPNDDRLISTLCGTRTKRFHTATYGVAARVPRTPHNTNALSPPPP